MQTRAEIEIDRSPDEVFAYISDPENNPAWQRGVEAVRFPTNSPLGKGTRYEQVAEFRGSPVVSRFEITDFDPGHSITIESIESTFPIRVTRRVEPLADGRSRVTADIEGEPGGTMRLFRPIVRRFAQHAVNADYKRLKELLEESPSGCP